MRLLFVSGALTLVAGATLSNLTTAGELHGSSWRLVNIASMDDANYAPDDPAKYSLVLAEDGRASLRADCNRASATWSSKGPGNLVFGPLVATRAMCPPHSLSGKYLAQFEWVRSYVLRDGHLFLATMADGAIIEFEPLPPVVATVLGEEIRARETSEVQSAIISRLLERYAAERGIKAEETELASYLENMRRGMASEGPSAEDELTPDEKLQVEAMRREMGTSHIRQWKINRSLFAAYGGRIIYQQLGPEPLDAYRLYFEERQKAGDFRIVDPGMSAGFWEYFSDDAKHDFMPTGSADEANAFASPPWEQQAP